MGRFILGRVVQGVIALLVIATVVFFMARATGDPTFLLISGRSTPQDIVRVRHSLGLDQPLYVQYWLFISGAVQGDFGESVADRGEVGDLIAQRLPNTLKLGAVGLLLSTVLGILMGVVAALKRGTWIDRSVRVVGVLGQSLPAFWVGMLLMFVFSVWLPVLPTSGMGSIQHYVLPATVMAFVQLPMTMRLMRSSLLDILDTEYVKLARLKGLRERVVIWKHAVRNALIPQLTSFGILLSWAIAGSVVVETVFSWPGIGQLAYQAMLQRDYPLIQGTVLTVAILVVVINLLVDILYAYVDPRMRYRRDEG